MLRARDLIHEMEETEAVNFAVRSQPHSPGVGEDFFVAIGRFNKENTLKIELLARFPQENWVKLEVAGEGADVPLTLSAAKELLHFFNPFFFHSWSRADLIDGLKSDGKWPDE